MTDKVIMIAKVNFGDIQITDNRTSTEKERERLRKHQKKREIVRRSWRLVPYRHWPEHGMGPQRIETWSEVHAPNNRQSETLCIKCGPFIAIIDPWYECTDVEFQLRVRPVPRYQELFRNGNRSDAMFTAAS
jgi:hypothetical protein